LLIAEHYDLFSGLIILRQRRQAWWRRSYDIIPHRLHRTNRETAAGKAIFGKAWKLLDQRYHIDLKLIYMLPITQYTTRRQFKWCRRPQPKILRRKRHQPRFFLIRHQRQSSHHTGDCNRVTAVIF